MTNSFPQLQRARKRAAAALKNLFVADALAMPVHWYYKPEDIEAAFPGGYHGPFLESVPLLGPLYLILKIIEFQRLSTGSWFILQIRGKGK